MWRDWQSDYLRASASVMVNRKEFYLTKFDCSLNIFTEPLTITHRYLSLRTWSDVAPGKPACLCWPGEVLWWLGMSDTNHYTVLPDQMQHQESQRVFVGLRKSCDGLVCLWYKPLHSITWSDVAPGKPAWPCCLGKSCDGLVHLQYKPLHSITWSDVAPGKPACPCWPGEVLWWLGTSPIQTITQYYLIRCSTRKASVSLLAWGSLVMAWYISDTNHYTVLPDQM